MVLGLEADAGTAPPDPPRSIYFMTNLRREPGPFFFFFLFSFFVTLTMSMFFRSLASLSRSLSEALVPGASLGEQPLPPASRADLPRPLFSSAALIILALVMYTGFAIPTRYMLGWISWVSRAPPSQTLPRAPLTPCSPSPAATHQIRYLNPVQ